LYTTAIKKPGFMVKYAVDYGPIKIGFDIRPTRLEQTHLGMVPDLHNQ